MSIDPRRLAPLAHRASQETEDRAAALAEKAFEGKLILRGRADRVAAAVRSALHVDLPQVAGATAISTDRAVQWLGPDEWLIITAPGAETETATALRAALADTHHQLVDVTDAYTTIVLSGWRSREMLMKIATIDFHPRAFPVGRGVTSNFGRTIAFARLVSESPLDPQPDLDQPRYSAAFEIIVRSSLADYLWCLLCEAGHEWGLVEIDPRGMVRQHLPQIGIEG